MLARGGQMFCLILDPTQVILIFFLCSDIVRLGTADYTCSVQVTKLARWSYTRPSPHRTGHFEREEICFGFFHGSPFFLFKVNCHAGKPLAFSITATNGICSAGHHLLSHCKKNAIFWFRTPQKMTQKRMLLIWQLCSGASQKKTQKDFGHDKSWVKV